MSAISILHKQFLSSLEKYVLEHSNIHNKPLGVDLAPPLPHKIRLYIYNAGNPPGGRPLNEYKIVLNVPGQDRGERGNFDYSDGRIVILAGFIKEMDVYVLWDADLYKNFAFNRNLQVKAETVHAALLLKCSKQTRNTHSGKEIVLAVKSEHLSDALMSRFKFAIERHIGGE